MASNRVRRIAKELADIQRDTESHIFAQAVSGDDVTHLRAHFQGPPDTPYEGGTFIVDVKLPNDYPFRPPVMKFETKLWHPNVSSQTVCYFYLCIRPSTADLDSLGSDLFGHAWLSMVSSPHNQIRPPLPTIPPQHSRTQRSSRCRSSKSTYEAP
jgi:hypothetical protein